MGGPEIVLKPMDQLRDVTPAFPYGEGGKQPMRELKGGP